MKQPQSIVAAVEWRVPCEVCCKSLRNFYTDSDRDDRLMAAWLAYWCIHDHSWIKVSRAQQAADRIAINRHANSIHTPVVAPVVPIETQNDSLNSGHRTLAASLL
jgi:hypothetical protein